VKQMVRRDLVAGVIGSREDEPDLTRSEHVGGETPVARFRPE
jgi:hypothetical protein